jgi:hypothetical protein
LQLTIFAGITGFDKSAVIKTLAKKCLKQNGLSDDLTSTESAEFVKYIKFEDELLKVDGSQNIATFLGKLSLKAKADAIEKTFTRINKQIKRQRNKINHLFLDIHLSYLRNSEYTPPLSLSGFRELVQDDTPIKLITLIDDVYVIYNNLKKREEDFPNTQLRLREILSWRSVEMLQAEGLAGFYTNESRNTKNYLVSVRHPIETLVNLIMNNSPKTGYMSYPITKTRSSKESLADINKARTDLHKIFAENGAVLFDPVTIDELVLKPTSSAEGDNFILNADSRWPINDNGLVKPFPWPIEIPTDQIKEVQPDIVNQIRARDFKLIDNALFTAVYRPNFGGFSTGVNAEITYSESQGRGLFVYDPPSDENSTQPKTNPFTQKTTTKPDYDSFLQLVRKASKSK